MSASDTHNGDSSPAEGHALYEEMHARVNAAVADLESALLSLDQTGYGSELNVEALQTAAASAALSNGQSSSNGKQRSEYVPEEDLGPLLGADGIQIPRAALLKNGSLPAVDREAVDSSVPESDLREAQHQSESATGAEFPGHQQHVRAGRQSLRQLLQAENMQSADALHVLQLFSDICRSGDLGAALQIVEAAVKTRRDDIVRR